MHFGQIRGIYSLFLVQHSLHCHPCSCGTFTAPNRLLTRGCSHHRPPPSFQSDTNLISGTGNEKSHCRGRWKHLAEHPSHNGPLVPSWNRSDGVRQRLGGSQVAVSVPSGPAAFVPLLLREISKLSFCSRCIVNAQSSEIAAHIRAANFSLPSVPPRVSKSSRGARLPLPKTPICF